MDRTELTVAVAATLIGAVLLGWVLAWVTGRLNARGSIDPNGTRDLVARLDAAEAREAELGARLEDTEAELNAALDRLERERTHLEELRAAYLEATQPRRS